MRTASAKTRFHSINSTQQVAKQVTAFVFATFALLNSGCTLCQPGYLCDYAGVGGKWQRTDPENGRVGSIFSDPSGFVSDSRQPAPVVIEGAPYPDAGANESIIEPAMEYPTSDGGVVILGDDW